MTIKLAVTFRWNPRFWTTSAVGTPSGKLSRNTWGLAKEEPAVLSRCDSCYWNLLNAFCILMSSHVLSVILRSFCDFWCPLSALAANEEAALGSRSGSAQVPEPLPSQCLATPENELLRVGFLDQKSSKCEILLPEKHSYSCSAVSKWPNAC